MDSNESELAMVQRHVREGKALLERQRGIVAGLEADGLPTGVAIALLRQFEAIQDQHEVHLKRVSAREAASL